ncbi:MAG TPA: dihydrolipoamide acetyltransferase family protein [Candidatus Saccharimonadaceae bacterium]|jgi:2-oxoglutarate dehydrogenase complex dihydrolipoamide succinyltransferase (E2) component|nr:dihydrolipoamide acetyltransferase family protein [Candidatus Saccharimonadaceae bacterium]
MPVSIVVPQLGESVAEGTVSKWLKAVGDRIRKEEPIVEIQTDKINVEIPAPADGTLTEILIQEGTTVLVGTAIGTLDAAGAPASAAPPSTPARAASVAPAAAPASVAPSPAPSPAPSMTPAAAPAMAPAYALAGGGNGGVQTDDARSLSPAVRKIMREQNVSLAEISALAGSGVAGRVTRDDLLEYLQRRTRPAAVAGAAPAAMPAAAAPRPGFLDAAPLGAAAGPREEVVPFSKVRRVIAENMVKAKHTAAHTHCFDEADMSAIVALRKEWAPKLEAQGIKLTYMPFFIKASVFALREFPWMNGSVTPQGDAMVVKRYYNIGMAVGRDEKGLIVPNLKDCDRKNLTQLAREVNDIAARARADRLTLDEIQHGTFSITNAGVFGAVNSSPVINVPEVGILGVHKIVERAVVRDGAIVARPMMNASIGFDHRVVDGELAVKFLRRVCELLEKPEMLWFYA